MNELRSAAARRGAESERIAAGFLEAHGLVVLARNFRCRLGELDLVCMDRGVLVCVEVRQRSGCEFGGALASITAAKRRRIVRAASVYLARSRRGRERPLRFDVIGIDGRPEALHEIVWVRAAFTAG